LFILVAMIGVMIAWRTKRSGLAITTLAVGCLYLAAMPVFAGLLIRSAEAIGETQARPPAEVPPGAIIVLAADYRYSDIPGKPDAVGPLTLERLAKAARGYRKLGLPILVSGGAPEQRQRPLSVVMTKSLEEDFSVPVRWLEDRSRNTFENARFSAAILRRAGIVSAFVVTQPWDMARALWSFRAVDYPVIPMSTQEGRIFSVSAADFLPQVPALRDSYYALHELIGLVWYRVRYGQGLPEN
jgi:uncharacterized SAM-binding protein YcdF (DUF218 family)